MNVITKAQYENVFFADQKNKRIKLMEQINQRMMTGAKELSFRVSDLSKESIQILIEKYSEAGWVVKTFASVLTFE